MRRTPSPGRTRGSELLEEWLKARDLSHSWLARVLGISQPSVSAWFAGSSRPEPDLRDAIRVLTGIDADLWRTEDELEERRQLLAAVEKERSTLPVAEAA